MCEPPAAKGYWVAATIRADLHVTVWVEDGETEAEAVLAFLPEIDKLIGPDHAIEWDDDPSDVWINDRNL